MTRQLRLPATLFALLLLAGCATTGPQFEPEIAAPTDRALVYFYRDAGFVGAGVTYMVRANGTDVSTLPAGGYFVYHASPGKVEFSAQTEARTSVTIDAKAGQTYYVKGTVGVGFFVGHPHLTIVPNDVGAKEIAACKLVEGAKTEPTAGAASSGVTSGPFKNAVVAISAAEIVDVSGAPTNVQLTVVDRRQKVVMERTTIGHTTMSAVVMQPNEIELIKSVVGAKLNQVAAALPPSGGSPGVVCDLTEFSVTTPATALYWDVTTDIAITLRVGDQQRALKGHAVKRTYAWPSESLIKTTTVEALKTVATKSGEALRELLAAPPAAGSTSQ